MTKISYSNNLNVQLLTETLIQFGIDKVVCSPGSRNGALMMHFNAHPKITSYSIVDERSAAFVALGMAQKSQKPVAICCTSGSAAANYYPAITEAFYQNIPLVVITADRPTHFTDLFDGQTIRQENLFEKHSYANMQITEGDTHEILTDNFVQLKKTLTACEQNSGPVHINFPFAEPFYDKTDELKINFEQVKHSKKEKSEIDFEKLVRIWDDCRNVLILVGMQPPNDELNQQLNQLAEQEKVIVLTETTSNVHSAKFINKIDSCIFSLSESELKKLQPDLLITLGQNIISKKIKQFLRNFSPEHHWHVNSYWQPDTYFCLTEKIDWEENEFLKDFIPKISNSESDYAKKWMDLKLKSESKNQKYLNQVPFCDWWAFSEIVQSFLPNYTVHYSNSSIIRYAQLFNHSSENQVFCNRGTSGIDGSSSTAIGHAMVAENPVILVTGDISFLYDSNALWNSDIPSNFRIILLNNGGGNIFKFIPGPNQTNAVTKHFEAKHSLTAEHLCAMFGLEYAVANNKTNLQEKLSLFYQSSDQPKLLEISTQNIENEKFLKNYFQ